MLRRWTLRLIAALYLGCAVASVMLGVGFFTSAQNQENAGIGVLALVLFGVALAALALALWTFTVSRRTDAPIRSVVALLIPTVITALVGGYAWVGDAEEHWILCSNLAANDPAREAAINGATPFYFTLLNPQFGHGRDVRYRVGERVLRLWCKPHGPCEPRDMSEQEFRAEIAKLPSCPPK